MKEIGLNLSAELSSREAAGNMDPLVDAWNWRYSALLHSIMANAFAPKQPSYITILSIDRQIRDFPVHPTWRPVCDKSSPTELSIQRWIILSTKEASKA
ncbi:hypothetical protein C0995_014719 [Termitomyces sp. Mi166|nr:hypothetical protein C0995_014719 [Termitomyces sp. Mi166\